MALFTDGRISEITDLTAHDTQLLNVASVEAIDVTQKLCLAQQELSLELSELLGESGGGEAYVWRTQAGVESVVITPALRLWHTFQTLELVYRDAYASQLNDRYAAKRDQFARRAKWAYEKLMLAGIAMCSNPIRQAAKPEINGAPGNLRDGSYYVCVAWVNSAGEEGSPSMNAIFTTLSSSFMVQPPAAPPTATSWNLYAGGSPDSMTQQNQSPLAIGEGWLQPDAVATDGKAPGQGQAASFLKSVPRRILRG